MKILLIVGGWSSERDVSLSSSKGIQKALEANGHQVTVFDLLTEFDDLLLQASVHDFAFLNLHGAPGEDGLVQAMLDNVGCPYQGSGPAGSFLALNKAAAKQIFKFNNLPTAPWQFVPVRPAKDWKPNLPFPIFVKSNTGGSSLRLGCARNKEELDKALDEIFSAGDEALLEQAVKGKDITCGVLGEEALAPVLIEPLEGEFFNYKSKYAKGGARETCPAPVSNEITLRLQKLALQAHRALGLEGYSRSDFICDDHNQLFLLEVNTLPGMTATSLVPQEAACAGLSFPDLLEKLIELGMQKKKIGH